MVKEEVKEEVKEVPHKIMPEEVKDPPGKADDIAEVDSEDS